jgi:hypothetical protein
MGMGAGAGAGWLDLQDWSVKAAAITTMSVSAVFFMDLVWMRIAGFG